MRAGDVYIFNGLIDQAHDEDITRYITIMSISVEGRVSARLELDGLPPNDPLSRKGPTLIGIDYLTAKALIEDEIWEIHSHSER